MSEPTEKSKEASKDSAESILFDSRSMFISEAIDSKVAKRVVTSLLALEHKDAGKPIFIYQNSPGGEVNSGFAIYDTIRYLSSPVHVVNTGLCASIATIINIAVPKERRFGMPNSQYLIHQPLIAGQIRGQATDIEITANEIIKTREKINKLLADACGQKLKKVEEDTNRDYWMSASQSLEYGLIGKIVDNIAQVKS